MGDDTDLGILIPWKTFWVIIILKVLNSPHGGMEFDCIETPPLLLISLSFLLYITIHRRSLLIGSSHFHQW